MAFSAFDGGAFHLHRSVTLVKLVVKAAGVADGISCVVTPPKWGDGGAAVEAGNSHVRLVVVPRCGLRRIRVPAAFAARGRSSQAAGIENRLTRAFFLLDDHPVIVCGAPSAGSRTPGTIAVTVPSTGATL